MSKGHSLQDPYLNVLRKERVPVSIYLVNGIKLQGQVESFDQFVVLLKNTVSQMVYKHAISTVVTSRAVRVPLLNEADGIDDEDDEHHFKNEKPSASIWSMDDDKSKDEDTLDKPSFLRRLTKRKTKPQDDAEKKSE